MVFTRPGIYEIVPYQIPDLDANSYGGGTKPGEEVGTYPRSKPPSDNARWVVAQVAGNSLQDGEFVFINVRNGYYLTAPSDPGSNSNLTCQQRLPTDPNVRFKIVSSPSNGYETYLINGVDGKGQWNVKGGSLKPTNIIYYKKDNTDNAKWYFDPA